MTDMRATGLRVAVLAGMMLVLGVAGCAQARPATPAAEPTARVSTTLSDTALDLAVRAGTYKADQRLLSRAEKELTRQCMAAHGWDYPVSTTEFGELDDDMWRPDLNVRRRIGYGFTITGPSDGGSYPSDLPEASRDEYQRSLSGDPEQRATLRLFSGPKFTFGTTGCIAESRIGLYGDVIDAARVAYIPQEVYNAVHEQVVNDEATRTAVGQWAGCMAGRGFPYSSPATARAAIGETYDGPAPVGQKRRLEIEVAVADGECVFAVGLPDVVNQIGRRCVQGLAPELRQDLNLATQLRTDALERAHNLMR